MKHYILSLAALLGIAIGTQAQSVKGVSVKDLRMERNKNYMSVKMTLDISRLNVRSNRAVLLTPRIVGENDSIDLRSVGVYGRNRYYYYVRNGVSDITGGKEISFQKKEAPKTLVYEDIVPYREWMDASALALWREEYGCCSEIMGNEREELCQHIVPIKPQMLYVTPESIPKTNEVSGQAFIDFPVNITEILPDYRENQKELAKIHATISPLTEDGDITIKGFSIKGFASPESPLANNLRLAKGRTAALKEYVCNLYDFSAVKVDTAYTAEDWEGLRAFVERSNLEHRNEILALIGSDRHLDEKERAIKRLYPKDYKFLLENCYPALRHSDYRIAYVIRSYTDIEEIKRVYRERPQNLSQGELYSLAQTMEQGSDEFNEVFETAVRMFPSDTVANYNAANNAMQRGDLEAAERYLSKTGNMPKATYAKAVLAYLREDYDTAAVLFEESKKKGIAVTEAETLLRHIEKMTGKTGQTGK